MIATLASSTGGKARHRTQADEGRSAVDEHAVQGAEQPRGALRDMRQSRKPMRQGLAGQPPFELLLADRSPELVDRSHGVVRNLVARKLEVFRPQPQPGAPREVRIGPDDVHL